MSAPTKPLPITNFCINCQEEKRPRELAKGWMILGYGFIDFGYPVCQGCAEKAVEALRKRGKGGSDAEVNS